MEYEAVSVVLPSWRDNADRLRTSIEEQTFQDYAIHVVRGVSPAARARNLGVANSTGDLVLFIDDDAYFGHDQVLEILVKKIRSDDTIDIVGSSKLVPPDATGLQRRIAREVPRWVYPTLSEDTESNPPLDRYGFTGITTTCCIMRRARFDQLGGFDEKLPTGEDTEFFFRGRRAGYRFVIPQNCWVYHGPPRSLGALLRKSFWYGAGHAWEARLAPERRMDLVPLGRWYGKLFVVLSPLLSPLSLFISIYFDSERRWRFGFRPLKALSAYATLYGYTWGWFRSSRCAAVQ
jgi:GT2 family glycosyltransferase